MDNENQRASNIVLRLTDELIPYTSNPRTHDDGQIDQIVASIREFGFTNPILVDDVGGVIAGHGRLLAAQRMGMLEVPTIELGYLSEEQRRAYVIADNKLSLNAGWDAKTLAEEMQQLAMADYDIGILGFSTEEVEDLLKQEVEATGGTGPEVVYEQAIQLEPSKEYIIIVAETPEEWDEMIAHYGLELRERGGYAKGSPMYKVSRERVLTFGRAKDAGRNTEQG